MTDVSPDAVAARRAQLSDSTATWPLTHLQMEYARHVRAKYGFATVDEFRQRSADQTHTSGRRVWFSRVADGLAAAGYTRLWDVPTDEFYPIAYAEF
jgi:hypothetical protein